MSLGNQLAYSTTSKEFSVKAGFENYPANSVSWYGATKFCNWLSQKSEYNELYASDFKVDKVSKGYRLPTEAEWEYSARAGQGFLYSSASTVELAGWVKENSLAATHEVGKKLPNAWGLYDMTGNVREWVNDVYDVAYLTQSSAVTDPWSIDPSGFFTGVLKGGSYIDSELDGQTTSLIIGNRESAVPDNVGKSPNSNNGFRVVLQNP